jgi:hypothetical protein
MGRFSLSTVFSAILLLMSTLLPAQTFHVLRSGSNCGTLRLGFEKLANGYMRCDLREERNYLGVDDRSVTCRRHITILVDSAFHILSISGSDYSEEGEFTIKGSGVDGVLYLSRERKGGRVDSRRDVSTAIPDVFLPELAMRAEAPAPDRVFFLHDLSSRDARVRTTEDSLGTIHISVGNESAFGVSRNGEIRAWRMPAVDLAWESEDSPVAGIEPCDIDCGVYWDAGQVTLPTAVENIRSMDIRLTITRDVGARLTPEDLRQNIVDETQTGAAAVRLHLARTRQRHGDATLPIFDDELLDDLKESAMLPVTAESVREHAIAFRTMDRSARIAADRLQRWISTAFVTDRFVPLVAADRLALTPRGTALHAAMLFVTLARATGLPARLVLGMHPEEERWRSTVWTEVWTERWQSIDPATGDFIDDATHVKLLHASDVEELRAQAGRLQGVVRIDIIDVEESDPGAAGELRTGIYDGAYSDRLFKCIVRAPNGWMIERRAMDVQTDVVMAPEAGSDVRFELQLTRNPYPIATQAAFDAKVRALGTVLPDAEIQEKGEIRIGNRKIPYVLYSYSDTRGASAGRRITTADCILTIADRGYLFRFTAPSTDFRKYDGELQDILQSIQLIDK